MGGSYKSSCGMERGECVAWVEKYFKDCVCDLGSEISFGMGIVSLVFWCVAEIPQILTNFRTKSAHGVSVVLLLTWLLGDIFNLVGCHLEPATLPTQYYTALLYTAVTVLLILQTFYYDFRGRFLKGCWFQNGAITAANEVAGDEKEPLIDSKSKDDENKAVSAVPAGTVTIKTSNRASPRGDSYYMSARSLASSGTPSYLQTSYLGRAASGPPAAPALHHSSDDDDDEDDAATAVYSSHHLPTPAAKTKSKPKRILSPAAAGYASIIFASASLPSQVNSLLEMNAHFHGRRLLKTAGLMAVETNPYGMALGWIMACIYMGGRLPQIYLNIKRGGVEGLNPFMFIFAIIANLTYVGSILMRSVEWEMIKGNAPWLLDAIACVLLDLFITMQFAYYKLVQKRVAGSDEDEDDKLSAKAVKAIV